MTKKMSQADVIKARDLIGELERLRAFKRSFLKDDLRVDIGIAVSNSQALGNCMADIQKAAAAAVAPAVEGRIKVITFQLSELGVEAQ